MKRLTLLVALVLSSCAPSTGGAQTAVAQTKAASFPTFSLEPIIATATSSVAPMDTAGQPATMMPNTRESFVLEYGLCAQEYLPAGDPKLFGCTLIQRRDVWFANGNTLLTVTYPQSERKAPYLYCALFASDGTLVSSKIAGAGAPYVACDISSWHQSTGFPTAWIMPTSVPPAHPPGSTGKCADGTYTNAIHRLGACTGHRGVAEWWGP